MNKSRGYLLRAINEEDKTWLSEFIKQQWEENYVVVHNEIIYPADESGFLVENKSGDCIGLLTYQITNHECEIITLDSLVPGQGIASHLIDATLKISQRANCRRVWLITTNDNLNALGFYQKRGFQIRAVYPNAVERSRKLKPTIPLIAENGIPIRDEIELELTL